MEPGRLLTVRREVSGRLIRRPWVGYAVAVAATGAATLARSLVDPYLRNEAQFVTFFIAVVVTGAFCGRGPALAATILSTLAVWYFFIDPRWALFPLSLEHAADLSMFVVAAGLIGWIAGRMHAAQQEATRRADDLVRSNEDLEQFAYVASHDLQEPLRMITGYLQLLADRYTGQLDEKADKYIAYAVDGAERMSGLIRDLLAFSRINTRGEGLQSTDVQEAFDWALRSLGSTIEASGAAVTHDPLPTVRGDKSQLSQLFQNLIGNAVKFRSLDRPPQIHVSVRREQANWQFSVQDNGIGFEQQYEAKMFMIFQRLHGRGEYPGTGIGLAICKRIVERHGGHIWALGEPGHGATFVFTIPA